MTEIITNRTVPNLYQQNPMTGRQDTNDKESDKGDY